MINPRLFATVHVEARAEFFVSLLHLVASQSFFSVVYNFAVSWKTALMAQIITFVTHAMPLPKITNSLSGTSFFLRRLERSQASPSQFMTWD